MQAQLPLLKITRHRGQNQYYEEPLGEGLPLRMMLIPAGRFTMGSPKDEPERTEAEGPQHEVAISQFFMVSIR